jgi:hypothetical protein
VAPDRVTWATLSPQASLFGAVAATVVAATAFVHLEQESKNIGTPSATAVVVLVDKDDL